MDDPGRVRSQITNVVCQIQRFDFDCNLVLMRKLIIRIPAGLGLNPLYISALLGLAGQICRQETQGRFPGRETQGCTGNR
jgi:hypothetical protein